MQSQGDLDDQLGQLMEEFLERKRQGELPSLSEFINRNPQLEAEICRLWPALVMLEQTDVGSGAITPQPWLPGTQQKRLGDFVITREIGRGGMGIVYEAEQVSLSRTVALKILPQHTMMNPEQLERFQREARAAAQLHHTNIVPVFHVGEEDGLHFYAMQYIRGQTLEDVLREIRRMKNHDSSKCCSEFEDPFSVEMAQTLLTEGTSRIDQNDAAMGRHSSAEQKRSEFTEQDDPSGANENTSSVLSEQYGSSRNSHYYRSIAELGAQVADALEYAHRHQVIHRDIKPSNLLLDTSGTIWVSDFGLVYTDESNLTRTGDLIGTLRYMAPERFEGKSVAQSDLYSLGITLHECLTLQPAYRGTDRAELIRNVTTTDPPRLRTVLPDLPRDLETIIAKATDADPAQRYHTAAEMGDDLRRFVDGRPIVARPTPAIERLILGCRRRPMVAALTGTVLVLVVVISILSTVAAFKLQARLDDVKVAEKSERQAKNDANRHLFAAYLAQAESISSSASPGRHFESLDVLNRAVDLLPEIDEQNTDLVELRTAILHATVLDDLQVEAVHQFDGLTASHNKVGFDCSLQTVVHCNADGRIVLTNVVDGQTLTTLPGGWSTESVPYTQISRDRRYIAIAGEALSGDAVIKVWDQVNDRWVIERQSTGANVWERPVAFSDDSQHLAYLAHGVLHVIELDSGALIYRRDLEWQSDFLKYSPDGKQIAINWGNAVAVVDIESESKLKIFSQSGFSTDVDWSPDGRYLAASCSNQKIDVWDVSSPSRPISTCVGHVSEARIVRFSPSGETLLSFGWDGMARLWQPLLGKELLKTTNRPTAFSQCNQYIGFEDGARTVGRWRRPKQNVCKTIVSTDTPHTVSNLDFHPTKNLLVFVTYNKIALAIPDDGTILNTITTNGQNTDCRFSQDGSRIIVGYRGHLMSYSTEALLRGEAVTGRNLLKIESRDAGVKFGLCGKESLIAAHTGNYFLINLAHSGTPHRLPIEAGWENWYASSDPSGEIVALSGKSGKSMTVRNVETGDLLFRREIERPGTRTVFNHDGQIFAMSGPGDVEFYSTDDWTILHHYQTDGFSLGLVKFSPDGRFIAVQAMEGIHLLDQKTFELLVILRPRFGEQLCVNIADAVCGLSFSPDSQRLAMGTRESTIHVWDLTAIETKLNEMKIGWVTDLPRKE